MIKLNKLKIPCLFALMLFFTINAHSQVVNYYDSWGAQGMTLRSQSTAGVQVNYSINSVNLEDVNVNGVIMKAPRLAGVFLQDAREPLERRPPAAGRVGGRIHPAT